MQTKTLSPSPGTKDQQALPSARRSEFLAF